MIRERPLKSIVVKKATVCPASSPKVNAGTKVGVLDSEHRFVAGSGLRRTRGEITYPPELPELTEDHLQSSAIYGGFLKPHFGHFILEGLARIWACQNCGHDIIWASGSSSLSPWQVEIFEGLNIDIKRFIFPKNPLRIQNLIIPEQGYTIQTEFRQDHCKFLGRWSGTIENLDKVYLSRSKFSSAINNVVNEQELEQALVSKGWIILYPESHSIDKQISVFLNAKVVAGLEGSAFHTMVFCRRISGKIVLIRRPVPNKNYDTIALTKGIEQISFFNELVKCNSFNVSGALTIPDPNALANAIDAI